METVEFHASNKILKRVKAHAALQDVENPREMLESAMQQIYNIYQTDTSRKIFWDVVDRYALYELLQSLFLTRKQEQRALTDLKFGEHLDDALVEVWTRIENELLEALSTKSKSTFLRCKKNIHATASASSDEIRDFVRNSVQKLEHPELLRDAADSNADAVFAAHVLTKLSDTETASARIPLILQDFV